MPLIRNSSYRAPSWLPGGHAQTIFPALFRRVARVTSRAERLELADGDFIDLQWADRGRPRLAILSHGLEADSTVGYIQGMAAALVRRGWDVLTWNFRGCGGVPNRLLRMYHSGATEDLQAVISHALDHHPADSIDLIGFSLGGNLTLKYLGEDPAALSPRLHRAVTFSVPCDLACSSHQLSSLSNRLYMDRFLREMRAKIRAKKQMFPDLLDLTGLRRIRTFQQFDDRYTAPIHGFRDAADYWARNSCRQFLPQIRLPTLLVNAANDPFLGPACYPVTEAAASRFFHFETPATGGHVGFEAFGNGGEYWSETRAAEFLGGDDGG
jgi:predicted alpha/beta-fold hydrolase